MISSEDILVAYARKLAVAGVGQFNENPNAVLSSDTPQIVLVTMPPEPDRVICLNMYGGPDDSQLGLSRPGLQVRARGGKLDVFGADRLLEGVFRVLQGLRYLRVGDQSISHTERLSWLPLGEDSNQRSERSDNYRVLMSSYTDNRPKRN